MTVPRGWPVVYCETSDNSFGANVVAKFGEAEISVVLTKEESVFGS